MPYVGVRTAEARDREVSVSGVCQKTVTPDRGAIVLTAEVVDKDLKEASRQATQQYEKVRDAVKKMGLENLDLRTSEYSLVEAKEWVKDREVSRGFRARMGLRVATSSIAKLGDVIAVGAREGLRDVGGLVTFLSEEKQQKERADCLKAAAEDARSRAERLASALGAKLGEVVSVSEVTGGFAGGPPPPMMEAMNVRGMQKSATAPPPIEAGQQDLTIHVNASFALR